MTQSEMWCLEMHLCRANLWKRTFSDVSSPAVCCAPEVCPQPHHFRTCFCWDVFAGCSYCRPCAWWLWTRIEGRCIRTAGLCASALAQVRERHEMHIVCVHLNKDKCQISMAPGSLHVRWSTLWACGCGVISSASRSLSLHAGLGP